MKITAIEPEDLELVYAVENDPSNWCVSNVSVPYSRYALRDYLINNSHDIYADGQVRFAIKTTPDDGICTTETSVGLIDLFNFKPLHQRAEIGYAILRQYQSHGLATEAVRRIITYARLTLHLHTLYAIVPHDNPASMAVLQKCHFTPAAQLKDWVRRDDKWVDAVIMTLTL